MGSKLEDPGGKSTCAPGAKASELAGPQPSPKAMTGGSRNGMGAKS